MGCTVALFQYLVMCGGGGIGFFRGNPKELVSDIGSLRYFMHLLIAHFSLWNCRS